MLEVGILLTGVFACSLLLTGIVRHYAITRQIVDIPNERSSHTRSMPRGGGISIVISFLLSLSLLFVFYEIQYDFFIAFIGGGLLVAAVGFIDDHQHVSARWRILAHFIAALWAIYWIDNSHAIFSDLNYEAYRLYIKFGLVILIVWLLNLYNFMDGIDGIAGIEAITTAGAAAIIVYTVSPSANMNHDYVIVLLLLLTASVGFVIWNWPPAKIFMGDVGSGFLGYIFALLVISTAADKVITIWTWAILLGIFIVDATFTLLRRIIEGKTWYKAHRSHAYQHAAQKWNSHLKVTTSVLLINIIWLSPLAWLASFKPNWGIILTFVAYAPLITLAIYLKAGKTQ